MKTTISHLRIRLSNFFRRLFKVHSPTTEWPLALKVDSDGPRTHEDIIKYIDDAVGSKYKLDVKAEVDAYENALWPKENPHITPYDEPCTDENGPSTDDGSYGDGDMFKPFHD